MKCLYQIIFINTAILFLFTACVDEMDYLPGEKDPQIVVNCLFADGEPLRVYLSTTISPYHDVQSQVIRDAQVEIFENNRSLGFLSFERQYVYRTPDSVKVAIDSSFTNNSIIPISENTYKIEITVPGHKRITASSKIPSKIVTRPITSYTITEYHAGYPVISTTYNFGFTDPPERNYYHVAAIGYHPYPDRNPTYLNKLYVEVPFLIKGPVIEESNIIDNVRTMIYSFSDWKFNGKDYEFEFGIGTGIWSWFPGNHMEVFISLNNTSKEFEYYFKSLMAAEKNKNNILADPIPIYTNVKNGLGIFAGYTQNVQKIVITKP